ncbi:carbonic anhydrase 14-like [Diadema setosum]|uniref:carbonic anhydrase 14-like n=1 Tax=Diadema antillarum TaxID=105358 RepID=UPI003A83C062
MFPYQCAGTHQSPISIQTTATERQELGMLQLAGYSERAGRKMTLANIGHTVGLLLEGNYTLHGGGLPSVYVADQIHFHWGRSDSRGSEHVLDRRKYPAEMHIVHHDVSMSRDRTIHTPGGLAVLAVLMEIGEENKAFDEIVNRLPDVQFKDEATPMSQPISVADLLPRNTDRFYRYAGSLTTPPCNEVVTWTVFQEPITISRNQLSALRRLYETTRPSYLYNRRQRPRPLSDNFRPPQQLNGRRVYRNGF